MSVWLGKEVAKYIENPPDVKINPNGVDLRASEVWRIPEEGTVTVKGKERKIEPGKIKIVPDEDGFYSLKKGTYEIRIANKITIPDTAVGFLYPRTTLNRFGIIKSETGLWDSGYSGYGTQTIHVSVNNFKIDKDEFWFQMMFMEMKNKTDQLYEGHWQGEKPE